MIKSKLESDSLLLMESTRTQGINLEAGNEAEGMEETAYSLTICDLLSLIFYSTQDYLPQGEVTWPLMWTRPCCINR